MTVVLAPLTSFLLRRAREMDTPVRRAMTAWRASKVETLRFNPLDPAGAAAAAAAAEAPAFSHGFGGALLLLANLREAGSTARPATIVARREPRLCMMMTMRPLLLLMRPKPAMPRGWDGQNHECKAAMLSAHLSTAALRGDGFRDRGSRRTVGGTRSWCFRQPEIWGSLQMYAELRILKAQ